MSTCRAFTMSVLTTLLLLVAAPGPAPAADFRPDPYSVQRYGPAYRYPQAGWIVLHVEGEPYERGYQHGRLLAPEIAGHLRCFAAMTSPKAPSDAWKQLRLLTDALFVRRYEKEYLEEMKGIADGATAAGARFDGRAIDLVDIVVLNSWAEIETLDSALEATPTGLEGVRFPPPQPKAMPRPKPEHCSAFAATGPATADGKIIFGHITMFSLYPANFYNVWLDLKPAKGHRVLIQTYPGGIQSGLDYYMNDAGLLVCETTIRQTRFDGTGKALGSRIRQALQYADSIDKAVAILKDGNNGLYTNEWLLADVKTNEIAMFELGTHKTKLWRSSKNEWFAGTEGFYWGCNNAKDIDVRLETIPSTDGRPANLVYRPSERDRKWIELHRQHKGKMGADFGKLAFTTPPLAAYHSLDAKYTTTDLAKGLKTWALFGPPLGRTWQPTFEQRQLYPEIRPLVSNPWAVLHAQPPEKAELVGAPVDLPGRVSRARDEEREQPVIAAAWNGTILPKTDGDVWLAAAFAEYEKIVALENALRRNGDLKPADHDRLAVELFQHRSSYQTAARTAGDVPLSKIKADLTRDEWYRIASGKGVLLLHDLRRRMGNESFCDMMDAFGRANAGQEVTTAQFQAHAEKHANGRINGFFDGWLTIPGLPELGEKPAAKPESEPNGSVFSLQSFRNELERCLIVCGTADETATNREAAEALQRAIVQGGPNFTVPIKTDKEVTDADLKERHLVLIGRPDSNALVDRFRDALPIRFGARSFVVRDERYAHPGSAVLAVGENPLNHRYSLVVIAGLEGASTLRAAPLLGQRGQKLGNVLLLPHEGKPRTLVERVDR